MTGPEIVKVVMPAVSSADDVKKEVDVDCPLTGQFEIAGAQLITVTTLVTKAVEIGISAEVGGTTGCEVKTGELLRRPTTTLLG